MFSLLNNWKLTILSFALIGALSYICVQKYQLEKLEGKLLVCEGNISAYNIAFNAAKQASDEQERGIRLREQEAARMRAQGQKRMDEVMQDKINGGCDGAMRYGIEKAQDLTFIWNSNIP